MNQPAVTIIFLADGTAVQTAGLQTPCDEQVQNLALAGQFGVPPVAGALRGEVWSTGGRILCSTNFDPSAPAPVAAAEPTVTETTEGTVTIDGDTTEGTVTEPALVTTEDTVTAPAPPPRVSGKK